MLVISDRRRAVALAQLFSVEPVNHRQMRERRERRAERAVEQNLFRRVGDVVVAAHHDGDSHRDVVGHDREVVDRRPVRAENDEVLDVLVRERDPLVDHVVPLGRALGDAEANNVWLACSNSAFYLVAGQALAAAIVLECLLA